MMAFLTQPAYSVTDAEFNEMKEQLQNALMKIQALEQVQKQQSSINKSGVVKTKSKSGLTINTSGGGIKIKSGEPKICNWWTFNDGLRFYGFWTSN
jgi:hypothetical protein